MLVLLPVARVGQVPFAVGSIVGVLPPVATTPELLPLPPVPPSERAPELAPEAPPEPELPPEPPLDPPEPLVESPLDPPEPPLEPTPEDPVPPPEAEPERGPGELEGKLVLLDPQPATTVPTTSKVAPHRLGRPIKRRVRIRIPYSPSSPNLFIVTPSSSIWVRLRAIMSG
jgi:hypothetical protein